MIFMKWNYVEVLKYDFNIIVISEIKVNVGNVYFGFINVMGKLV